MGLESIPFLTAIISSIGAVIKAIWDFAKQRVILLGVFFVKLAGLLWDFVSSWVTYKYALFVALAVLFATTVSAFIQTVSVLWPLFADIKDGWQAVLDVMPGFAWLVWNDDGFFRLSKGLRGLVPIFIGWISGFAACFSVRSLRVMATIALNAKLGKGS